MKIFVISTVLIATLVACNNSAEKPTETKEPGAVATSLLASKEKFKDTLDGKPIALYYLRSNKLEAAITNFGGRVVNFIVPDVNGKPTDIIVGFDSFKGFYESKEPFFGALIGRYGNRIAKGKFTLDGTTYQLPLNNGPNTLHGGPKGFHNVVWDAQQLSDSSLQLSYLSKDGEQGFPGNLTVKVVYTLTSNNELKIEYESSTDKKTVANLSNHNFWNLNGEGTGTINDHLLTIAAKKYSEVDSTLIPTSNAPVMNTPFDFTSSMKIGERIGADHIQLKYGKGYDHNFVLDKGITDVPVSVSSIQGDQSKIVMETLTTEPGLQFYGGNFMQSLNVLKGGKKDEFRTAFCLETQHFPDSPNQPSFPVTVLEPGKTYRSTTLYRFYIGKAN